MATRGEIACRLIRTLQGMGITTVSVYSEANEDSLHVAMADEAYLLGPTVAFDSYLKTQAILKVAKKVELKPFTLVMDSYLRIQPLLKRLLPKTSFLLTPLSMQQEDIRFGEPIAIIEAIKM